MKNTIRSLVSILCVSVLFVSGCSGQQSENNNSSDTPHYVAEYTGDATPGTLIDSNHTEGIHVYQENKNGTRTEVENWTIKNSFELMPNSDNQITIFLEDDYCVLHIKTGDAIDKIFASYDGDRSEGVILDESNKGIHVKYKDIQGNISEIDDWTVQSPVEITSDGAEVVILYKYLNTTLFIHVENENQKENEKDKTSENEPKPSQKEENVNNVLEEAFLAGHYEIVPSYSGSGHKMGNYYQLNLTDEEFDQITGDMLAWYMDFLYPSNGVYDYQLIRSKSNRAILINDDYILSVGPVDENGMVGEDEDGIFRYWQKQGNTYVYGEEK